MARFVGTQGAHADAQTSTADIFGEAVRVIKGQFVNLNS